VLSDVDREIWWRPFCGLAVVYCERTTNMPVSFASQWRVKAISVARKVCSASSGLCHTSRPLTSGAYARVWEVIERTARTPPS
jgi:hypothetical protein